MSVGRPLPLLPAASYLPTLIAELRGHRDAARAPPDDHHAVVVAPAARTAELLGTNSSTMRVVSAAVGG